MSDAIFAETFQYRDNLKAQIGLLSCLQDLERQHNANPADAALVLNYGICLFETDRFPEAEKCLRGMLDSNLAEEMPSLWRELAIRYLGWSIAKLDLVGGITEIFVRLDCLSPESRSALVSFVILFLATPQTLSPLVALFEAAAWPGGLSPPALRKLYEMSCASGALPFFEKVAALQDSDGARVLLRLLYWAMPDNFWQEQLEAMLASNGELAPIDAYRLSLQAVGRLQPDMAEVLIRGFVARGDAYWPCLRPLGTLYEVTGRVELAVDAYHKAGLIELQSRGRSEHLEKRPIESVKISCIALCFNDESLVAAFCRAVMPHCDEIVVNDGGSTDGTIEAFEQEAAAHGFSILVIRDRQKASRARSIYSKEGYRKKGLGGVDGFEADRRRNTTLLAAKHDYILLADLDDYFPPYPNLKTVVASTYGIEHFIGAKCEMLDEERYCDLRQEPDSCLPTLFRRDPMHVFSGLATQDEYLARLDKPLDQLASKDMRSYLSHCYSFWHLKFLLDPSFRDAVAPSLGPQYSVSGRYDRPDADFLRELVTGREKLRSTAGADTGHRVLRTRDALIDKIWRGKDPFADFPRDTIPSDTQGWRSTHRYLQEAIETHRPRIVVEVGVWKGGSTITMAQAARELDIDCVVLAVDTWLGAWDHWAKDEWFESLRCSGGYPTLQKTFMQNVVSAGVTQYVIPVPLDSINAANVFRTMGICPDIVHIDAGHDYRAVQSDLQEWFPLIRPGGLLIGDDYGDPGWPGVTKAFDEQFGRDAIESDSGKCRVLKPGRSIGGARMVTDPAALQEPEEAQRSA